MKQRIAPPSYLFITSLQDCRTTGLQSTTGLQFTTGLQSTGWYKRGHQYGGPEVQNTRSASPKWKHYPQIWVNSPEIGWLAHLPPIQGHTPPNGKHYITVTRQRLKTCSIGLPFTIRHLMVYCENCTCNSHFKPLDNGIDCAQSYWRTSAVGDFRQISFRCTGGDLKMSVFSRCVQDLPKIKRQWRPSHRECLFPCSNKQAGQGI